MINILYNYMVDNQAYNVSLIFYDKTLDWIKENIKYKCKSFNKIEKYIDIFKLKNKNKKTKSKILTKIYTLTKLTYMSYNYLSTIKVNGYIIPKFNDEYIKYFMIYDKKNNNVIISLRGTKKFNDFLSSIKFYRVNFDILKAETKEDFIKWRNNEIKNKIYNANNIPIINDEEIEIHKGFYQEALTQYNTMKNAIQFLLKKYKKINVILTGHSLGGAVSKIISILLLDSFTKKKINIYIYTFNSPPVGNKNLNLLFPYFGVKRYSRIYNHQDFIVTYGENGTWLDKKKFRHYDFLLKNQKKKYYFKHLDFIYENLDFGDVLEEKIGKINTYSLNYKYIYHSFFCFSNTNKILYI